MFDPKDPDGSLKRMQEANRTARLEQLDQSSRLIQDLHESIKKTLTPKEYQEWERKMAEPFQDGTEYHATISAYGDSDESCIIANYFRHQQSLPPSQRKNYCHISCPCSRCRPHM